MKSRRERYPHKVAAVYPDAATTESALLALGTAGLKNVVTIHLEPDMDTGDVDLAIEPEREQTRNAVARDTIAGGAAGTVAGAVAAGAASVVAPTLFVSAPVVGSLIVLGYGAMIGGMTGAIRGLKLRENVLAGLVKDALRAGCHVVIVHAAKEAAWEQIQAVIEATMTEETAHT
ncbi:MAG: hypothetical protein PVJ15_02865 [Gammaproteobacteria bacterium]|jgi:hypothetical protein